MHVLGTCWGTIRRQGNGLEGGEGKIYREVYREETSGNVGDRGESTRDISMRQKRSKEERMDNNNNINDIDEREVSENRVGGATNQENNGNGANTINNSILDLDSDANSDYERAIFCDELNVFLSNVCCQSGA